jgi:hypothetical protein
VVPRSVATSAMALLAVSDLLQYPAFMGDFPCSEQEMAALYPCPRTAA